MNVNECVCIEIGASDKQSLQLLIRKTIEQGMATWMNGHARNFSL